MLEAIFRGSWPCKLTAIFIIFEIVSCTDDYAYLNKAYLQAQRLARSQKSGERLDGLYSIESMANNLYLTARQGKATLGKVVLKKFSDSASQLWEITKFDTSRGYNLKPLANDFNMVTSTLNNNAHAYNAWEFKRESNAPANIYIVFNTLNTRCLQASGLNGAVAFHKCEPTNVKQQWKLTKKE